MGTLTEHRNHVRDVMEEIVKEKGYDYVYERRGGCVYKEYDGSPSCLIGHYVARRYPHLFAVLSRSDEGQSAKVLLQFNESDDAVLNALTQAQIAQDLGDTWGQALTKFNQTLTREAAAK